MRPRPYVPPEKFIKTPMKAETIIAPAEYLALLKAARDKGKMVEFYSWQRNRKIILKG